MAVQIDDSLLTFQEKLSSGLGSISSVVSKISSKTEELKTCSSTAVTSLNSSYQGDGLTKAIDAFKSIEAAVDGIKASIPEGPEKAISMAEALLTKIDELDTLKKEIDQLESDLSKLGGERSIPNDGEDHSSDKAHNQRVRNLKSSIETKTNDFNTKHDAAKGDLAALKALNPTIDTTVPVAAAEATADAVTGEVKVELQNLKEGTYNLVNYTGKNGRTIKTYIYVPVGASSTTGLAVDVSMGGDGAAATRGGALTAGVGKQLAHGATYSGIVIVLEAENTNTSYSEAAYLDTAKELCDNVVTTYKADSNKISINGYSYGVYGATHMMERFPNYFCQAVLVAGGMGAVGKESGGNKEEGYKKISGTKVHFICGSGDSVYREAQTYANKLESYGGTVTFETRKAGHEINTFRPITVNGVTYDNYVEFCLAQSK
jgi:enterochelin esterase-like enzyme